MNFLNWMNMNMIIDIAFLVFSAAVIWKMRKHQKLHDKHDKSRESIVESIAESKTDIETKLEMHRLAIVHLMQKSDKLEEQIISVAKNPQAARRKLKQNQ